LKGEVMKIIPRFDQINGAWLKAVQQSNTPVAELSGRLVTGQCQLYEAWLTPENEPVLSPAFLTQACCDTPEDLLEYYEVDHSPYPLHVVGREHDLATEIGINLSPRETSFHFSVLRTQQGPVISVVFGSCRAMRMVYERGLRERKVKQDA
jgi:hypothetical protein